MWDESDHPRDWHGRFTSAAVGRWAGDMSNRLDIVGLRRGDRRPDGFDAAVARHAHLWNIPEDVADGGEGRDRTDAEHDEAEALDDAFKAYRKLMGLDHGRGDTFVDSMGRSYDEYGRHLGDGPEFKGKGRPRSRTANVKAQTKPGARDGLGRRYEDVTDGAAAALMVAHLKRVQPRARMEGSARQPVRRTPRGTPVDGWMGKVDAQMRGNGRG
jgi:hypothetical protein